MYSNMVKIYIKKCIGLISGPFPTKILWSHLRSHLARFFHPFKIYKKKMIISSFTVLPSLNVSCYYFFSVPYRRNEPMCHLNDHINKPAELAQCVRFSFLWTFSNKSFYIVMVFMRNPRCM